MAEILVVDDDAALRLVLRTILEDGGHTVREAAGGHDALKLLRQQLPDLIITDIYMPDGDGLELIYQLRTLTQAPVIAISGGGRHDAPLSMLTVAGALGATRVLQKPFTEQTLLDAVREALKPPS